MSMSKSIDRFMEFLQEEALLESQKVVYDACIYGVGYSKDGKHIPREDVTKYSDVTVHTMRGQLADKEDK